MSYCTPIRRRAFHAVEVLLVLGIFLALLALLLPVVQKAREGSHGLACRHHLKEIVLAVHAYHQDRAIMPPYASGRPGQIFGGWFIYLMPYLDQHALYLQLAEASDSTGGVRLSGFSLWKKNVMEAAFPVLVCPSDPTWRSQHRPATTNYLANWFAFGDGSGGPYSRPQRFHDLRDGLSNIVLFAEGYSVCDNLPRLALLPPHYHNFGITQQGRASDDASYAPTDYTMFQVRPDACDNWRAQTPHEVMHVALADGSVRGVAGGISPKTWKQALKPRDGEVLDSDW